MNNYGFLNKSTLSYILNNIEEFDKFTINQVTEYCDNQGWDVEKIKRKKPIWKHKIGERLNYEEEEHKIVISVKEKAKRGTLNGNIFIAVVLLLSFLCSFHVILNHVFENRFEFIMAILSVPFIFLLLISVLEKIAFRNAILQSKIVYQILETRELIEINDGKFSSIGTIKSLSLFWNETDDFPKEGFLKIKMTNGKTIDIEKEDGIANELFQIGLKISKFLDKNLLIFVYN